MKVHYLLWAWLAVCAMAFTFARCANGTTDNGNEDLVYCESTSECSSVDTSYVCCSTEESTAEGGELTRMCAPPAECCDCFGTDSCQRCDGVTEVCEEDNNGIGTCVPMTACEYPACTRDVNCQDGEVCCTDNADRICDNCTGECHSPTSLECTTQGWMCGSVYSSAWIPGMNWGSWVRKRKEIALPSLRKSAPLISATFRWQHDAGRPPPHDLALGVEGERSPLFQVFGRDGKPFARFGMQVVPLESTVTYELRISFRSDEGGVSAHALLRGAGQKAPVLAAWTRVDASVRALWHEQIRTSDSFVGFRVSLVDFHVQTATPNDGAVAARHDFTKAKKVVSNG